MNDFYTYAYLREDKTPYYIGKGLGNRAYDKRRAIKPPKDKSRILFLKKNLTEEEAFKHEIYMIDVFGRKDLGTGILHNKTSGGEGSSGAVRSDETRKKISVGMSGEKNPQYGVPRTEESKKKQSETKKGVFLSEEHRRKISDGVKGKTHSEEHRRKNSEARKGELNPSFGKRWWNDGNNTKFMRECPGDGWKLGRKL